MKYIIDHKVYDTEKSTEIIKYTQGIEHKGLFVTTYPRYEHTLYKSQKGQFFVHIGKYVGRTDISYNDKDYIELQTEEDVKKTLEELNEIDKYIEIFISEFWCGVLATIGVEFVALIGYAIQQIIKQNKEGK